MEEKDDKTIVTAYILEEELDETINKLDKGIDYRFKESLLEVSSPYIVKSSVLERLERKEGFKEKTPVENCWIR